MLKVTPRAWQNYMDILARAVGDELGPAKVVLIREPRAGLDAIVVVDNVACGPAIGGVRMAPDVTVDEVFRLARAMTIKNAAAGLPHGGGKAGIVADPAAAGGQGTPRPDIRADDPRAHRIHPRARHGHRRACMAWVKDEIDRAVGLPRVIGGIPLDEIGATGLGVAVAAEVAAPKPGSTSKARAWPSRASARWVSMRPVSSPARARLVAASDSRGAIQNPPGSPSRP